MLCMGCASSCKLIQGKPVRVNTFSPASGLCEKTLAIWIRVQARTLRSAGFIFHSMKPSMTICTFKHHRVGPVSIHVSDTALWNSTCVFESDATIRTRAGKRPSRCCPLTSEATWS